MTPDPYDLTGPINGPRNQQIADWLEQTRRWDAQGEK